MYNTEEKKKKLITLRQQRRKNKIKKKKIRLTWFDSTWPKIKGTRYQQQCQEGEQKVEKRTAALVILKLLSAHFSLSLTNTRKLGEQHLRKKHTTLFMHYDRSKVPIILFVNKLDINFISWTDIKFIHIKIF